MPRLTHAQVEKVREALISTLNLEGCALAGGRLGAYQGLDVPWHFAQVRAAIVAITPCPYCGAQAGEDCNMDCLSTEAPR